MRRHVQTTAVWLQLFSFEKSLVEYKTHGSQNQATQVACVWKANDLVTAPELSANFLY